jgi:hypothetical protein
MTTPRLGRLERVTLREAWLSESADFTPWLAQEENLSLLAETIGIELELESTEKNVGPFRADILCKDTLTDSWVLIENQLERTDHSHLGQLLTYAAGLNTVTIVWIAERFTDEHRAALDWLNEVTDESINFFGLEVELWRIGQSDIAPKFNIVSQPNDWTRIVTASRQEASREVTPLKQLQREYWTALRERLIANNSFLRSRTPPPRNWYNFAIGRSKFRLTAYINTQKNKLGVDLAITGPNARAHYQLLLQEKAAIEAEMGHPLTWFIGPKNFYILIEKAGHDPLNREDWPVQHTWLHQKLEQFYQVLRPRILALNAGGIADDDSDDIEPDIPMT